MLLEEYISNKTLTGDKIQTCTQDYIYSTILLLSLAQNITYCTMFHSSQNICTVRYKTGILWWLQHYVRASAVTVSLEVKLEVKQFETTLLCSQNIKQLTPSVSSLTSKQHSLYVLLMAWQVKQDLRLVAYVLDLQLLADPTHMPNVVFFFY